MSKMIELVGAICTMLCGGIVLLYTVGFLLMLFEDNKK